MRPGIRRRRWGLHVASGLSCDKGPIQSVSLSMEAASQGLDVIGRFALSMRTNFFSIRTAALEEG